MVFDCKGKANGFSLNDALLQGPDLMSPLLEVLLKFRQREVAYSGDIRDMFHMVKIRQEDSPALRFLWMGRDRDRNRDVYQMDVMIFGAVSSPYQAQYIKNRIAQEFEQEFPEAAEAIQKQHYVDDYLDSTTTIAEAILKIEQVREIHRRGGFEIRGWQCNKSEVLEVVAGEEITNVSVDLCEDKLERVLGLHWNPKTDEIRFKTNFRNVSSSLTDERKVPTKREILKLVMSLYDPLGFVANLTIRGRILLQEVWRSGTDWDEPIAYSLHEKWFTFLEQVKKIPDVRIDRCYAPGVTFAKNLELHVFADASSHAFSAVAYLRATSTTGEISVNIVFAKSRVTPLKCTSIPRLEMEAALVAARMSRYILEHLDLPIEKTYHWTDSRNVLCWIKAEDPRRFKMYIAHRIGEILENTELSSWRWVPTADNVADDATRDVTPADLSESSRWIRGPSFLLNPEDAWPQETKSEPKQLDEDNLELRKVKCMVATEKKSLLLDLTKYSDFMKVIRTTAWMLRFRNNASNNGKEIKPYCTVVEIREATLLWIRIVQKELYAKEIKALMSGGPVEKKSPIHQLSPCLENGIVCMNSRLGNARNLPIFAKKPVILCAKHPFTRLLISWYHRMHGHLGVEMICNELDCNEFKTEILDCRNEDCCEGGSKFLC